jgi:hypothetical protein
MKTSTSAVLSTVILAAGLLPWLGGCKPERSGTAQAPSEAAPGKAALEPAPVTQAPAPQSPPVSITATQGSGDIDPNAATFAVAGMDFTRPSGWALASPGPMRAAQLEHPAMPSAAIVFTHFGERGAGAVADNLTRWARQVVDDRGQPTLPEVTEANTGADGGGRKITFARYEGTYLAGTPGQAPTPMPGTLFLGAIIEGGPQGPVYMRAFGPSDAMSGQVEAIFTMLLTTPTESAQ